jgi:hypothetical protein
VAPLYYRVYTYSCRKVRRLVLHFMDICRSDFGNQLRKRNRVVSTSSKEGFWDKGLRPFLSSSILSSFAYDTVFLLTTYEWVEQSGVLDRFCIDWRQKVALYVQSSLSAYIIISSFVYELRFRSLYLVEQGTKHGERQGRLWGSFGSVLSSSAL